MFPKGKSNTDISRDAQHMALFRSSSDRNQIGIAERMFGKNRPRFMSAYFSEKERAFGYIFVDNHPDTPRDEQVLSDIFGSCLRYPTIINSSAESDETFETTSNKKDIACEARSSVKLPAVVKSSPQIARKSRPFPFDAVWSEAAYSAVQNYIQGASCCQSPTSTKRFWDHGNVPHCQASYDPYLSSYSYQGNYWPVIMKIRHFCNGKSNWIYLHKDDPSVRSFLEKNQTNAR